ncbi:hypothetical protein Ancab_031289 [Ancistrocladus abbreviatus]
MGKMLLGSLCHIFVKQGVNSLGPRHVLANLKELLKTILSPEFMVSLLGSLSLFVSEDQIKKVRGRARFGPKRGGSHKESKDKEGVPAAPSATINIEMVN